MEESKKQILDHVARIIRLLAADDRAWNAAYRGEVLSHASKETFREVQRQETLTQIRLLELSLSWEFLIDTLQSAASDSSHKVKIETENPMTMNQALEILLGFELPCDPLSLLQNPERYLTNEQQIERVYALKKVVEICE